MLAEKLSGAVGNGTLPTYIEDVFSTYLYTGNGSTQNIVNGIDLSTKGGLVWLKGRNSSSGNNAHVVYDTVRGRSALQTYSTAGAAASSAGYDLTSFNTDGFSVGPVENYALNSSSIGAYASWTFRKQPKFFDVVTYTGNGVDGRQISHSLGSTPGCVIVKRTDAGGTEWLVYHRSVGASAVMVLNTTDPAYTSSGYFNAPSSTYFSVQAHSGLNASGGAYVAYLFAHDAGGFGLTGTDNVISCGSFTTDGNGTIPATTLGYEPQWVIFKPTSTTGAWTINDTMRGQPTPVSTNASAPDATLYANNASAESQADNLYPTATGFKGVYAAVVPSTTYIYIAIRRGPMKVPTDATKVFAIDTFGSTSPTPPAWKSNFPVDFAFYRDKSTVSSWVVSDRLRSPQYLEFNTTAAEQTVTNGKFDYQNGWYNSTATLPTYPSWMFKRAPSFFDEVCFTSANGTQAHNLGVAPELVIMKTRGAADSWYVFTAQNGYGILNNTNAWGGLGNGSGLGVNLANVTSTTLSAFSAFEGVGVTCVAYLFATAAGVSKVGNYTGTGTTKQVDCGFAAGARFVLIKRTDSTGDWYVWDTARGIVSGNDPYLLLNSTAAEVTSTDYIDPYSAGFELSSTAPAALNASGGTYIFLAIA